MTQIVLLIALLGAVALVVHRIQEELRRRGRAVDEAQAKAKHLRDVASAEETDPGGSPADPIEIVSPAVVEPRSEGTECLRCGGPHRVLEHAIEPAGEERLRVAHIECRQCGHRRTLYFRLRQAVPN